MHVTMYAVRELVVLGLLTILVREVYYNDHMCIDGIL